MPMLRYRTRDLTRIIPEPCPCDRQGIRLARVKGRSDDMIIIRGVNLYPSQVEAVLGQVLGLSLNYQLEISEKDFQKELTVHCESSEPLNAPDSGRLTRLSRKSSTRGWGRVRGSTCWFPASWNGPGARLSASKKRLNSQGGERND